MPDLSNVNATAIGNVAWHHLTVSMDGARARCWVDGMAVVSDEPDEFDYWPSDIEVMRAVTETLRADLASVRDENRRLRVLLFAVAVLLVIAGLALIAMGMVA